MQFKTAPQLQGVTHNDKYVVHYDFSDVDHDTATEEFTTLLSDLESVGLHTEVRTGYDQSLLVFVKAPKEVLRETVYKSRVKDWLYGISREHPRSGDNAFEAEDILSVYHLVNWSKEIGGAGITPGFGKWKNVKSIFPLHNERANQELLFHLSKRLFLRNDDLDRIRNLLGAKIAFYFAFMQTYLVSLFFPAITGYLAWAFLPKYSLAYAMITCLWCTVFLEYWKIREIDLSIRWNVKGVGSLKVNRPQFTHEKKLVDHAGRVKHYFPKWKQISRQMLVIPFILISLLTLGFLVVLVFVIEVCISEAYEGPYKSYMEYLPTILLAAVLPYISSFLEDVATKLTEYENHRTQDYHEMSLTQKIFVLNFITTYLPIFLTAFVYVPFGDVIIPRLEKVLQSFLEGKLGKILGTTNFHSDPDRLRNEVIALTITGQISDMGQELIYPYLKHKLQMWYREFRDDRSHEPEDESLKLALGDHPGELTFLKRARNEATLEPYNVQEDISEMVIQFGYLALFSPVWPLVSIGFLINNWIELRSDFLKICIEHQRPAPIRMDGLGPWIGSLDFLTWLGSISTSAVVHLFGGDILGYQFIFGDAGGKARWYALPITIFVGEHVFLGLRSLTQFILGRIGSKEIKKEKSDLYAKRKAYLDELEAAGQSARHLNVEERQRRKSALLTGTDLFWTRQVEDGVSAQVGRDIIMAAKMKGHVAKKE
ncbi:plasma membrane channel protein [Moniliophthora roreri]|nr:plasma membrane channel protein [Moniliophthora roreri]